MEFTQQQSTTKTTSNSDRFPLNQSTQSLPPSSSQCSSIFIEYQLMKEFVLFQKQEFLHVYISPSYESAFEWFGVMFIHHGLYKGKIFRFSIHISPSYPNCDIPQIIFDPIPHHPLLNEQTGQLKMSSKFNKWTSTCNFIFEVIAFAKQVFEFDDIKQLKHIANIDKLDLDTEQLRRTIEDKMKDFNDRVINMKNDDKNYIDFTEPENSSIIDKVKHKLLKEKFSLDSSVDYFGANGNLSSTAGHPNRNYCTTSISGLSWAKKIVYN
ncbi:ubiquitin E2 variant domain-containing protein pendolino [Dermatophagoides pteronyssinus]|uniref:ubiquitin E2 variant domain-containing protein pendolino n=1 Tax=Dermatophagoides pteronyssinus TaxID=6956 RepID=UPI003F67C8E0